MKYFRMSYEEVVFNRSYLNILLLNRSIPSMKLDKDDDDGMSLEKHKQKKIVKNVVYRHESELFSEMM